MQRARELLADAVRAIYPDDASTRYVITQLERDHLDMISMPAAMQAIAAALRAAPDGYVLVPAEPTPEMIQAACECGAYPGMNDWWRAMLAARPQGVE